MQWNFIYLAIWFILPALLLFINQYSHATPQYSPIIFLFFNFPVKQCKETGENILTHSVLLCLVSLIHHHFHCIDCHLPLFNNYLWPLCWLNQSGNMWWGTQIPLRWAYRILDAIVHLYIRFIICLLVVVTLIWSMQFNIPVKPIFGVWNGFRCTTLITFGWMTVDCFHLADIQYLGSSSREVLCRQSWWHRWSFWQFECSRTIMLTVWPGCFDDLFDIWNASYCCYLVVLSVRFLLCRT